MNPNVVQLIFSLLALKHLYESKRCGGFLRHPQRSRHCIILHFTLCLSFSRTPAQSLLTDSVFAVVSHCSSLFSACRSRMLLIQCKAGRPVLFALILLLYLGSGEFSVPTLCFPHPLHLQVLQKLINSFIYKGIKCQNTVTEGGGIR